LFAEVGNGIVWFKRSINQLQVENLRFGTRSITVPLVRAGDARERFCGRSSISTTPGPCD
jgi:hypothetical protein